MATAVYTVSHHFVQPSSSYTNNNNSYALPPAPQDDQYLETFFCRALYDYQSTDDSSLSFRKGEIIEVLTRLESGWWDGLLGEERGWFPSNYVSIISDEEADIALAEAEMRAHQSDVASQETASSSTLNGAPSVSHTSTSSRTYAHDDHGNWAGVESETSFAANGGGGGMDELAAAVSGGPAQSSDFWVPQVTSDGQIYYVNTQTGQQSRDLPTEPDDELSDADFGPHASNRSRSASNAGEVYGRINPRQAGPPQGGFGVPRRTGTPEPWVRRLADDGLTYFYVNKHDGTVRWTSPEGTDTPRANGHHHAAPPPVAIAVSAQQQSRLRGGSTTSFMTRSQSDSVVPSAGGAYSDDSDVDPMERPRAGRSASSRQVPRAPNLQQASSQAPLTSVLSMPFDQTAAEKAAASLQSALAPLTPESLTELAQIARHAVNAVVTYIQDHGVTGHTEDQNALGQRILDAVVAIRNLLIISSPPYGQIPHTLYPRGAPPSHTTSASAMHAQLKPTQRRVTATLSKLVLAALAAQYDTNSLTSDAPVRMEADALELERALGSFVLEVQRANTAIAPAERTLGKRRLFAAFLPANLGVGLFGAGAAAMWKGFGWIALPETEAPSRTLPDGVFGDLRERVAALDESLSALLISLRAGTFEVSRVRSHATASLSSLQAFLRVASSINFAKTVDIDGVNADGKATTSESYLQSVHRARQLVRTAEAAVQALHDDGAVLFSALQHYPQPRPASTGTGSDSFQGVASMIRANAGQVIQIFEALLLVGQEQADKGQNDYRGSIDWRASRLLSLDPSISQTLSAMTTLEDAKEEGDEIVGWDFAITKGKSKIQIAEHIVAPPPAPVHLPPAQAESSDEASYKGGRLRPQNSASNVRPPAHRPSDSLDSLSSANAYSDGDADSVLGGDEGPSRSAGLSSAKSPSRAEKLIKMFGDVPSQILVNIQSEKLPWYLKPSYNDKEILIDPDGKVRGGTVPALVERLTAHEHVTNPAFTKAFLMTFKTFTDIDTLFDLLAQRFWIQQPEGLTPDEIEEWTKKKRDLIRTRVLNTFKTMIQDEDVLEKNDLYILDNMKELVSNEQVSHMSAAKHIVALIERAKGGENARAKTTTISLDPAPPPIFPRTRAKLKLLDFEPLEVARQLTMIECQLFMKIRASECLTRSKKQKTRSKTQKDPNDNIAAVIELSNQIAHWVADTVLDKEDSRKRALIVKHFISIADRCRELRNFSSMIAIIAGLNSPHISRLKRTTDQVNQKFQTMKEVCAMTIDSHKNFTNYRQLLQRITPPCVPFIGVYLTTLTFIQDGAPNNLPGDLVNFRKRVKAAEVIQEIQKWHSKPYNFTRVEPIYDYLQEQLNKFNDTPDVSNLFWERSLEREPKEKEDEKIARLLQETGFL